MNTMTQIIFSGFRGSLGLLELEYTTVCPDLRNGLLRDHTT
jgi:hypothetical protein